MVLSFMQHKSESNRTGKTETGITQTQICCLKHVVSLYLWENVSVQTQSVDLEEVIMCSLR